jgi:hypothetical protein
MLRLSATRSHFYPGARGFIAGGALGPAEIEFADGSHAAGHLDGPILAVGAYVTAAGTHIGAARWRIDRDGGSFRVTGHA